MDFDKIFFVFFVSVSRIVMCRFPIHSITLNFSLVVPTFGFAEYPFKSLLSSSSEPSTPARVFYRPQTNTLQPSLSFFRSVQVLPLFLMSSSTLFLHVVGGLPLFLAGLTEVCVLELAFCRPQSVSYPLPSSPPCVINYRSFLRSLSTHTKPQNTRRRQSRWRSV